MYTLSFDLRKNPTEHGYMPTVTMYLLDRWKKPCSRPMVLVIPGGGYGIVCKDREGERIALRYNAAGFHAAVLEYAVKPHRHPEPIQNTAEAIRIIRAHAEEWQVNPDWIAVCGFSAGGHLAASISTLWNDPELFSAEDIQSRAVRPNASVLCYPVISSKPSAGHVGSFVNLIGEDQSDPLFQKYSLEDAVDQDTCPAFLFHTFKDQVVPLEHTLLYAEALRGHDVPFEMHIYPNGVHGLALQSDEVIWSKPDRGRDYGWMQMSVDWLNELFGTTEK